MSDLVNLEPRPGRVKIEEVIHITEKGNVDITGIIVEFNIHSSVFITSSVAVLTITDHINYLANGELESGDTIKISITYNDATIEYRYKVSKIESIVNFQSGKSYNVKLISDLEYTSIYRRISQSFVGQTSEIAMKIFEEYGDEKYNIWEPSIGHETVCIPMWSPIKTIDWLAKRSRSNDSPSRFMFFQDSMQRYNFMSLAKLREFYQDPVMTYVYNRDNLGEQKASGLHPNSGAVMNTIFSIEFQDLYDARQGYDTGTLRNTKIRTDFTTKTIDYLQNSYWDTYSAKSANNKYLWKYEETEPGKISLENTQYNSTPSGGFNKTSDETTASPRMDVSQQCEIMVVGTPAVDIGMLVNIEIPTMEPESSVKEHDLDQVWSGLYYVVAKRDVMDRTGHKMALRLVKGSKL